MADQYDLIVLGSGPGSYVAAICAAEAWRNAVGGALAIATVMSATGSFDHRAIDGADGAQPMQAIKTLVKAPLGLVA